MRVPRINYFIVGIGIGIGIGFGIGIEARSGIGVGVGISVGEAPDKAESPGSLKTWIVKQIGWFNHKPGAQGEACSVSRQLLPHSCRQI